MLPALKIMTPSSDIKLYGADFHRAYEALPSRAKETFNRLRNINAELAPLRFNDRLTEGQRSRMHHVTRRTQIEIAMGVLRKELRDVPVLSIAICCGKSTFLDFPFICFGTFSGHVALFDIAQILDNSEEGSENDMIPGELRSWLMSDEFVKVHSGLSLSIARGWLPYDITVRNQVDSELLYQKVLTKGFISQRNSALSLGSKSDAQMIEAVGYHHKASTEQELVRSIGENLYNSWPEHRSNLWEPVSKAFLDDADKFFLFYEAMVPHLIINKILRQNMISNSLGTVTDGSVSEVYLDLLSVFSAARIPNAPSSRNEQMKSKARTLLQKSTGTPPPTCDNKRSSKQYVRQIMRVSRGSLEKPRKPNLSTSPAFAYGPKMEEEMASWCPLPDEGPVRQSSPSVSRPSPRLRPLAISTPNTEAHLLV